MGYDFNQVRKPNAKLIKGTIDKLGTTYAVEMGGDGFSAVTNVVAPMPTDIKEYLEGDTSITVFACASNIDKLCEYALTSFPNIEDLYLFKTSEIVVLDDNLTYLSDLEKIYVPSDLLSAYISAYPTLSSKFDTIVEDYTLTIPYVGIETLTSEYVDSVIDMLSAGQKNAITKLVIPTDFSEESAINIYNNYNWSVLPNLTINNIWYGTTMISNMYIATLRNMGSEDTSLISYEAGELFQEFIDNLSSKPKYVIDNYNNEFVELPLLYRKVLKVVNNQIVDFSMSTKKLDDSWKPYPCFVKNNTTINYIWVGKSSYNDYANNARTTARNYGIGYQLYDWQFETLLKDLKLMYKKGITGTTTDFGITDINSWRFVDGANLLANGNVLISYEPDYYVNDPTEGTTGYIKINYNCVTSSGNVVKKLGYDENNEFINIPTETSGVNNTYYSTPVYGSLNVRKPLYFSNLVLFDLRQGWNISLSCRLCYRPIGE